MKTRQVSEFKETKIGKIPEDWEVKRIEELYEIRSGLSKPREEFGFGYPFLTFKEIFKNFSLPDKLENLVNSSEREREVGSIKKGDIFVTRTSETWEQLGMSSVALKDYKNATFNGFAKRLRPINHKIILPEFAAFLFRSPKVQNQFSSFNSLTTRASLSGESMKLVFLIIPTKTEQKKIAKILSDLTFKIQNLQNQNKVLEQIAQAIFKSWFVDFDGVTEFEDSELGQIPKGWEIKNMSEIIEINPLRNLKKGKISAYLGMADIPIHSSRISQFYLREFTSGMKFMNGDTLVARITPSLENGKTAFVDFLNNDEVGWGSTEYIVLRPKLYLPPEYGYCFARTDEFRSHAIMNMTGTSGRQRVPENCFDDYKMVLPPRHLTEVFGKISKKIFLKIKANAKMRDNLIKVREILLPKLMSGEIRV